MTKQKSRLPLLQCTFAVAIQMCVAALVTYQYHSSTYHKYHHVILLSLAVAQMPSFTETFLPALWPQHCTKGTIRSYIMQPRQQSVKKKENDIYIQKRDHKTQQDKYIKMRRLVFTILLSHHKFTPPIAKKPKSEAVGHRFTESTQYHNNTEKRRSKQKQKIAK